MADITDLLTARPVPPIPISRRDTPKSDGTSGVVSRSVSDPAGVAALLASVGAFKDQVTDPLVRQRFYERTTRGLPGKLPLNVIGPLAENLFPVTFAQRQRAGLEDPTIAPIIPGGFIAGSISRAAKGARAAKAEVPGFLRTAEDLVSARGGRTAAARPSGHTPARATDQQVEALQHRGLSPEEARSVFAVAPEGEKPLLTHAGAQFDPAKMTRAIQTALGQFEGGGMPEILAPYSAKGPFGPKDPRKHGGVVGAVTRAVMAGDQDITSLLGPDLTQQIARSKFAHLAREAGATEDAIRSAFGLVDNAAAGVTPEAKALIRRSVRTGEALTPEAGRQVFAAQHRALAQAGVKATDEVIESLTDKLVAEAKRVNKAVDAQRAPILVNEPYPSSVVPTPGVAGAGERVAAFAEQHRLAQLAREAAPPPITRGGGVPPTIRHVRDVTTTPIATTLFEPAVGGMQPNRFLPPGGPPRPAPPIPAPSFDFGRLAGDVLNNILNVPKVARASLDIGQLGRQGFIPVVSAALSRDPERRLIARNAFVNAVRGYGDKYAGKAWLDVLKDPLYSKWRAAGGNETLIPAKSLKGLQVVKGRDDVFTQTILENVPGVSSAIDASNRSFALTLNALSFKMWKHGYEAIRGNRGIVTQAEQGALANWYNVAAGRGRFLSSDQKILQGIFWAPNLFISRMATPVIVAKYLANPGTREVGKMAAKDVGKSVAAGLSMLAVADMSGLRVDWNPTSSTFLTVRIGNFTLDPWAGFRQPFVLAARLALGVNTTGAGRVTQLGSNAPTDPDASDLIFRFLEGKLGPTPGLGLALASGHDFVGEPFGPRGGQNPEQFARSLITGTVIPLSPADAAEAVISDLVEGTSAQRGLPPGSIGAGLGALTLAGVGVQVYDRPTIRDGIGREIMGDQKDPPPHPVLDTWSAARRRAVERAERTGGSPEVPELIPPDKYIGGGERRITLSDQETDRLRVLVGQERERVLGQIIRSPAFLSLDPRRQETMLLATKKEADRVGQEAFAVELALNAKDDAARVRAARVGLNASSGVGDRMDFVARLSRSNALTPEMEGALDDLRDQSDPTKPKYEPTVNELLTWNVNAQRYVQSAPWRVGDPQVWSTVARQASRLRALYNDLRREADAKGVPVQRLADYRQYARDYGGTIVGTQNGRPLMIAAFIDISGDARAEMISPQRAQIEALPLWDRFRDAVKSRDPYAIR
jgi:hypothetical protein